MQARLTNSPLNFALAKSLMENLAPQRLPCAPTAVIRIVADHFNLRVEDLTGRKRTKEIANARQIAMYLLREENDLSLPAIGEHLGGRDHSTVRYGVEAHQRGLERDESTAHDHPRPCAKKSTPRQLNRTRMFLRAGTFCHSREMYPPEF